jgi:hypothetical protein
MKGSFLKQKKKERNGKKEINSMDGFVGLRIWSEENVSLTPLGPIHKLNTFVTSLFF